MRRLRQYLAVVIIMTLFWSQLPPSPVWGQNTNVTLRLTPPELEVAAGQTVDVAVNVENVSGLYGFDITLAYDPAIVEVLDLDPDLDGVQLALGLFLDPGFVIFNQADNSLGQLRLVMTQLNPSEAKTGDGNLMVIRFQALQAGDTPLMLLDGQLAQQNGATFFPELVDGQLTVTTTSLGQPIVFTPIPSQIAGTPLPTTTPELLPTLGATATPTGQPPTTTAATTVATSTTTPPATELPAGSITPAPTIAATVAEGDPNATTAGSPAAATEVASVITAAGTALVSDLNQVNDSPPVIVESETTAVTNDETAGVSVIGSNTPAGSSSPTQASGAESNQPTDSWVVGASFGGGLLLAIVVLFFVLSRKRAGGAS